jgi:hypothetical protein
MRVHAGAAQHASVASQLGWQRRQLDVALHGHLDRGTVFDR